MAIIPAALAANDTTHMIKSIMAATFAAMLDFNASITKLLSVPQTS